MENGKQAAFQCSSERTDKVNENGHPIYNMYYGLTKREYFAAMAMQGIILSSTLNLSKIESEVIAGQSLQFADSLLEALEKH
jgi:hypothetical protein